MSAQATTGATVRCERFGASARARLRARCWRGRWLSACVAQAATIDVTTTEDPAGPGSCPGSPCSLRQAVDCREQRRHDPARRQTRRTERVQAHAGQPDRRRQVDSRSLGNGIYESVINGEENHRRKAAKERILKVTAGTLHFERLDFTGGEDGKDENLKDCNPVLHDQRQRRWRDLQRWRDCEPP